MNADFDPAHDMPALTLPRWARLLAWLATAGLAVGAVCAAFASCVWGPTP